MINPGGCLLSFHPPSDYRVICSNDATFLPDTSSPEEKLSWEKALLPDESLPADLYASKCDDFEDRRGYYALLGCGNISSEAQIKYSLLQEKSTFRIISLANHPDKSHNPKYHDNFKVTNNKW